MENSEIHAGVVVHWAPTQPYHQGNYVSSPSGLVTTMNQFFIEKMRKQIESIPTTNYDPLPRYNEEKSLHFLFYSSDCQEVQSIISKLRGSKATKLDFIDVKNFKAVSKEISPCLVHVINLTIKLKLSLIFISMPRWSRY